MPDHDHFVDFQHDIDQLTERLDHDEHDDDHAWHDHDDNPRAWHHHDNHPTHDHQPDGSVDYVVWPYLIRVVRPSPDAAG